MKHCLTIVGLDYRLDVYQRYYIEQNRQLGLAWRTKTAPIWLVSFDRVERRPRRPPTCLV
jgi:hypothetical protein